MGESQRRVAVVTGAARGIGKGIAERLAGDGLAVALWDLNAGGVASVGAELGTRGHDVLASAIDVTEGQAVRRGLDEILSKWGRLDVLVNNAGWDKYGWFLESREEDWDRIISVNYRAILVTCRYLLPTIVKAPHGRVVNIASGTAKLGYGMAAVYSGAKGAVIPFSRALAREVAPTGTTVNVVCPGATDTPLLREDERRIDADETASAFFPDGFIASVLKQIPLGRLSTPEDIANMVAFLVLPESGQITGQTLSVDGGQTMY
jgi:2-hydroxycyclohexanecarboxyl-CoA dehydrogenase